MKRLIYLLPIYFLTILGCSKNKALKYEHGYFMRVTSNYAWGWTFVGYIIDENGKVWAFDKPANWNAVDSNGYISLADLKENIANCNAVIKEVSIRTLNKYNKQIADAANGTLSLAEYGGNDMGQVTCYCFQYDASVDMYKQVMLSTEGDFNQRNTSNAAENIFLWMKTIK